MRRDVDHFQLRKDGEWYEASIGLCGILAPSFQVHASDYENFLTDESREAFLVRKAEEMISLYGDARDQRLEPQEVN